MLSLHSSQSTTGTFSNALQPPSKNKEPGIAQEMPWGDSPRSSDHLSTVPKYLQNKCPRHAKKQYIYWWHRAECHGKASASEYSEMFTQGPHRDVRQSLHKTLGHVVSRVCEPLHCVDFLFGGELTFFFLFFFLFLLGWVCEGSQLNFNFR